MIYARPTEHLTGITVEGTFEDFNETVDSIYRMTGLEEDYNDRYWAVKNRLLGVCYDIRHAYMGDRNVLLKDNGMDDDKMKWHSIITPKQNVYYSVEILSPEAVFVALAVPDMYFYSRHYYGEMGKRIQTEDLRVNSYTEYLKDKAILDLLSAAILEALAAVIGDEELEKLLRFRNNRYEEVFAGYVTHYLDKCNIEYIKTAPEKRKDKLRNITKRLVQKPAAYENMKWDLEQSARQYHCSIYELYDPRHEYPEEIVW